MTAPRIKRILTLEIDEARLHKIISNLGTSEYQIERSLLSISELTDENEPVCIIARLAADATRPGALFEHLNRQGLPQSVVYLTEEADVRLIADAIQSGALTVLDWPVDRSGLLGAVGESSSETSRRRREITERVQVFEQLNSLSSGERDVLDWLLQGASNKVVARRLGVSLRTIEVRRKKVFVKMEARNLAELVTRLHLSSFLDGWEARSV